MKTLVHVSETFLDNCVYTAQAKVPCVPDNANDQVSSSKHALL